MTHEQYYIAFIKEIENKCEAANLDVNAIVDQGVNQQDAEYAAGTEEYWDAMIYCAAMMAGNACAEQGASINEIMGRSIY